MTELICHARPFFRLSTNPARKRKRQRPEAMLRTYQKLEDVPEALREHYVEKDGLFVAQLDKDHPVLANNAQLKTEKEGLQRRLRTVTDEKTQLEGSSLPEGHVAVSKADKALLDSVKAMGDEATIKEAVEKYPEAKTRLEEVENEKVYDSAASALGYTNSEAFKAAARANKLAITKKEDKENGKTVEKFYVGDKLLSEHIESTPDLKALEPAFKTQGQVKTGNGVDPKPKGTTNTFARIREEVKATAPETGGAGWLQKRFGRAASNV